MQVQLVCRSDKGGKQKEVTELPFDLDTLADLGVKVTVLVPTVDDYHAVHGELLLKAIGGVEVVCLIPPSEYKPPVGHVPHALVTDTHKPYCDPIEAMPNQLGHLVYYFSKLY